MNKTARVALRTLTANWGLTANEAYEMLAEEELAEYLAEMEAEMWAEEMEAGGNKLKPQYKSRKDNPSTWWIPNKYNEDRGGNGRGGQKNKNYLYYDYGKADSYNKDYWKRWKEKSEAGDDLKSHRENCPDMRGGSMPCKRTKEQQERFEKSRKKK